MVKKSSRKVTVEQHYQPNLELVLSRSAKLLEQSAQVFERMEKLITEKAEEGKLDD